MTQLAFRLVKSVRASKAFDGEGARRIGGRWNSPGTRMVYTAKSLSLAQLEVLVHFERHAALRLFSVVIAEFPTAMIRRIEDFFPLPPEWDARPPTSMSQALGDRWLREGLSAVLSVPTVISEGERNLLINPAHPDFSQITLRPPVKFLFDSRLDLGVRRGA